MLSKLLDRLWGNKVKIVEASALYAFAEWRQTFIFNSSTPDEEIKKTLWNRKHERLSRFSILSIVRTRTKNITAPEPGMYRPHNKAKVYKWFDD